MSNQLEFLARLGDYSGRVVDREVEPREVSRRDQPAIALGQSPRRRPTTRAVLIVSTPSILENFAKLLSRNLRMSRAAKSFLPDFRSSTTPERKTSLRERKAPVSTNAESKERAGGARGKAQRRTFKKEAKFIEKSDSLMN